MAAVVASVRLSQFITFVHIDIPSGNSFTVHVTFTTNKRRQLYFFDGGCIDMYHIITPNTYRPFAQKLLQLVPIPHLNTKKEKSTNVTFF